MMKMIERLLVRQYMILPISHFILGTKFPKKEKIYAKVLFYESHLYIELLDKNRHKRPSLEEILNHPWFGDFKDIHNLRMQTAEAGVGE